MSLAYQDDWLTIYGGDCRTVLAELPDESVHCVVTSPPYWGLRDYGTATWEGGEDGCDHLVQGRFSDKTGLRDIEHRNFAAENAGKGTPYRDTCGKCGAVRIDSQLGLEPTPEQYVENMVAVFREVRRVLRSDGTVWLNLGDSYAVTRAGSAYGWTNGKTSERDAETMAAYKSPGLPPGLKPKDLVGIPWRVAFALQADGWYLRSDIIWSKPNPMPESVTDRPTKSHEYVFLLSKSPRYYFDADAVREQYSPATESFNAMKAKYRPDRTAEVVIARSQQDPTNPDGGTVNRGNGGLYLNGGAKMNPAGRNIRTVWTVATQPYPGAHFAVFPEKLIEPCILAGTSERGVCPECGKPWRRVTERGRLRDIGPLNGQKAGASVIPTGSGTRASSGLSLSGSLPHSTTVETTGWQPSCAHDAEPIGAVVLDPFGGSGTTARVANRLSRRAVLIDLNPEYLKQQMDRNRDIPLGLGA